MENYQKAEKDYMDGMKYKDIADKYNTTINTVKSWKKRYAWERVKGAPKSENVCTQNKKVQPKKNAPIDDGTKETLQNENLTPEQQMFCICYSKTFNATQSYLNAYHCNYNVANAEGYKMLVKPCVREEIQRLKEIKRQQIVADTNDLVEMQMRIAFADIGNYLTFGRETIPVMGPFGPIVLKDEDTGEKTELKKEVNSIRLAESTNVDTQIIQEVKQGRDGVSIKLADKQKAMDWLTMFFEANPADTHKREFDKRKLELELTKLEMNTKAEEAPGEVKDNFLDALNLAAKDAWSDE